MTKIKIVLLIIFLSILVLGIHSANFTKRYKLIQYLTDTNRYNPNYPPGYDKGVENEVTVQLFIDDVTSISEKDMEYRVMMNVIMKWQDKRLNFRELAEFSRLHLAGERVKLVWIPELFIRNERKTYVHAFLKDEEMAYIKPDGEVQFRKRLSMTNFCHMEMNNYPFDVQHCEIAIESYVFAEDILQLKWSVDAVKFEKLRLPNYDISIGGYSKGLSIENSFSRDGAFSKLSVILQFKRKAMAYRSSYFIPYPLFFMIAMSSFAFKDQIGSRISLCTVGITTSMLQWIGIYARLPPVRYLTFLDWWIFAHIGLISLILVYHSMWYMCLHQASKEQDEFEEMLRENLECQQTPNILPKSGSGTDTNNLCYDKALKKLGLWCCLKKLLLKLVDEKILKRRVSQKDFMHTLSLKEKQDKRYKIISKRQREDYYKGYVDRLGHIKCEKAIRKNLIDFCFFLVILVVYSLLMVLFIYWSGISKYYLIFYLAFLLVILKIWVCLRKCSCCDKLCEQLEAEEVLKQDGRTDSTDSQIIEQQESRQQNENINSTSSHGIEQQESMQHDEHTDSTKQQSKIRVTWMDNLSYESYL